MKASSKTNKGAQSADEPRSAGRPEFSPTKHQRAQVEELAGAGMNEISISRVLDITPPTLRKHFADELATGRDKKRAEIIAAMFKSAVSGNVSAQRAYLALGDASYQIPTASGAPPPKEKPLGKKEEAQLAAQNPDVTSSMGELMARRMSDSNVH